jgi:DNA mismatch endonuclease (patch repair protein)
MANKWACMDIYSKNKRSEIMSHVRGVDSKIEILLRKMLWRKGYRYRKNSSRYYGKPDVVLPKYKTAIFVDSCFWHGCKSHFRLPATRSAFWAKKINGNVRRDKEVSRYYKENGWKIIRIWEHDLKSKCYKFNFNRINR